MGLKVTISAGIAWLTLDRPDRLNSFMAGDYRDLRVGLEQARADPSVRVIVLTGAGRAFSAGADRSLMDASTSPSELAHATTELAALLDILGRCEKPTIAAVNGSAVGVGCTILLYFDLVVMSASARLRLPFTALGMVPEAGSTTLLPLHARWADTVWAMLSSEWIDAPTAYRMGIAWRIVPDADLIDAAEHAASTIAMLNPEAVSATKELLITGRADIVRSAVDREFAKMSALFGAKNNGAQN